MIKTKLLLLVAIVVMLTGCAYSRPASISQPPSAGNVSVIPISPDPYVWRPDSTRVTMRNYSLTAHLEIWLDKPFVGEPDLKLQPEQASPANFAGIGSRVIYLHGREMTPRGWRDLGVKKKEIWLSRDYDYGGPGEIPVGDWDFE